MKGSLKQEPNGSWSWSFEHVDASGKRRQRKGRGFRTQKEAAKALRERLRLVDKGRPVTEPSKESAEAYLRRWLEHHSTSVRPSVAKRYKHFVEVDFIPIVGHLPLAQVGPMAVIEVLNHMRGRGLSPATVTQGRAILGKAMKQAVKWGLVEHNPVSATERPRVAKAALVVPEAADLAAVQEAALGSPWEVSILLAVTTGARRGEVLGLRWRDVDLERGRLRIEWALQRQEGELRYVEPKTEESRRTVVLTPSAWVRLRRHKVEQAEALLAVGVPQTRTTPVCTGPSGEPLCPDAFTHAYRRLADSVGVTGRLHDVRHAVGTMMSQRGIATRVVSSQLGHSDPAFTARVYQETRGSMLEEAAEALEKALAGRPEAQPGAFPASFPAT